MSYTSPPPLSPPPIPSGRQTHCKKKENAMSECELFDGEDSENIARMQTRIKRLEAAAALWEAAALDASERIAERDKLIARLKSRLAERDEWRI